MSLKIITPSRLHMSLIDLNASIGRVDGGIGLAIKEPKMVLEARESERLIVEGGRKSIRERAEIVAKKVIEAFNIEEKIEITIKEDYPQHVGLGSGTQISLAVAKAIAEIYGFDYSIRELARIVSRGGTSGIGVAAFEGGGFILDGGHSTREKPDFLPSSASKASPAPLLARCDFPDWKIAVVIPRGKEYYGEREVNIFKKYCPIAIEEVQKLSHLILMKILPAVVEEDIESFGEGINEIQNIGFKKIEVSLQPKKVRKLMEKCREVSYGVGLSSFGPSFYCIVENPRDIKSVVQEYREEARLIVSKANNNGAIVI